MKLSELKQNEEALVVCVNNSNETFKRRILDMGITHGVKVSIKRIAPLGDPVCLKLRGYELCLRKVDLESIEVEKL